MLRLTERAALSSFELCAQHVRISSFLHEKSGRTRHDVLMHLDDEGTRTVETLRRDFVDKPRYTGRFIMREPHVTHSTHWDEAEALASAAAVMAAMPLRVYVTGFTVD